MPAEYPGYRERSEPLRTVAANGIRLAYVACGSRDAPPAVLLHALGEDHTSWAPVAAELSACFRVYAFDLRGHGSSDWPGTYSFQLMRDDVLDALDQLGLGPVTLIGHSMGGAVGYLIAEERPGLVDRLVIEDAPPPFRRDRSVPERPAEPLGFDWRAAQAIISQVNRGDWQCWEDLSRITAPTLLVGGGPASHIPQHLLEEASARIPRCDLMTIPAGHYVHNARPEEFARAVLGWLRG